MSVCLSIIKVLPNVKYLGTDYEKLSKSERKNITELPDELFIEKFSDNQAHSVIDLTLAKNISFNCGKNRYWKKIKKMNLPYNSVRFEEGFTYHAVTVDVIGYRQGWFLKKRFFHKNCTLYMTNKKSEMIGFMKKYFDFTNEKAIECYQTFIQIFEDGMLFQCAY